MPVSQVALAGALTAAAGADVASDATTLAASTIDGLRPRWVVRPATIEAVARILAVARDAELAVAPRGAGSALTMGAAPSRLDVVLDMTGLAHIVEYHPDDLTVTVQAGVTAGELAARLAPRRQTLPLDPPGWMTRTLGGITATGAAGPLRARFGTLRDLLLGVRFVQPDGVVTWGGAKVVKSVTGYDVPKLMVGALGTLGVVVELTLRLHPLPESEATWLLTFPSAGATAEAVAAIIDSTLEPNRVEWLGEQVLALARLPTASGALAVSIASVASAVRAQAAVLTDVAKRTGGALQSMIGNWWHRYDRLFDAPDAVVLRLGTLPSRLAATSEAVSALDSAAALSGAATVGALRAVVPAHDVTTVARGVERLRGALAAYDGSVVIERAPLAVRQAVDPWGPVPAGAFDLMRRIRDEVDPTRVLNPGRFVAGL